MQQEFCSKIWSFRSWETWFSLFYYLYWISAEIIYDSHNSFLQLFLLVTRYKRRIEYSRFRNYRQFCAKLKMSIVSSSIGLSKASSLLKTTAHLRSSKKLWEGKKTSFLSNLWYSLRLFSYHVGFNLPRNHKQK